jgi:hypothetical protein
MDERMDGRMDEKDKKSGSFAIDQQEERRLETLFLSVAWKRTQNERAEPVSLSLPLCVCSFVHSRLDSLFIHSCRGLAGISATSLPSLLLSCAWELRLYNKKEITHSSPCSFCSRVPALPRWPPPPCPPIAVAIAIAATNSHG